MGDLSKLPKWAQEKIANLERRLEETYGKIDQLSSKHDGSNVQVSGYSTYPDWSLPDDSKVTFFLSESRERYGNAISVRSKRNDKGVLHVSSGGGYMNIRPVVSNVVEIRLEGY